MRNETRRNKAREIFSLIRIAKIFKTAFGEIFFSLLKFPTGESVCGLEKSIKRDLNIFLDDSHINHTIVKLWIYLRLVVATACNPNKNSLKRFSFWLRRARKFKMSFN